MKPFGRDGALRTLLRFVAAALVLGSGAAVFEDRLVAAAMPPFRGWLSWIDSTYRTIDLSVTRVNGEAVVQRIATPAHPHVAGDNVVYADPRTRITTEAAAGIVLQPLVLAMALVLAWPWRTAPELAVRMALATPLAVAVVLLDVPLILVGVAWYDELSLLGQTAFSPLVYWADFMNAGGRFALTVVAVAVSVWASAAQNEAQHSQAARQ